MARILKKDEKRVAKLLAYINKIIAKDKEKKDD